MARRRGALSAAAGVLAVAASLSSVASAAAVPSPTPSPSSPTAAGTPAADSPSPAPSASPSPSAPAAGTIRPNLSGSGSGLADLAGARLAVVRLPGVSQAPSTTVTGLDPVSAAIQQKLAEQRVTALNKAITGYNDAQDKLAAANERLVAARSRLTAASAAEKAARKALTSYVRGIYQGDVLSDATLFAEILSEPDTAAVLHTVGILQQTGTRRADALAVLTAARTLAGKAAHEVEKQSGVAGSAAAAASANLATVQAALAQAKANVAALSGVTLEDLAGGVAPGPVVSAQLDLTGVTPPPLPTTRHRADVTVTGLSEADERRVRAAYPYALTAVSGTVSDGKGHTLHVLGVDPAVARAYAPAGTAEVDAVWQVLASGAALVSHSAASDAGLLLGQPLTVTPAGTTGPTQAVTFGALATLGWSDADVVVTPQVARRLGVTGTTMLLPTHAGNGLSTATTGTTGTTASADTSALSRLTARLKDLAPKATTRFVGSSAPAPSAFRTGTAALSQIGTMRYTANADGSINPEPTWVSTNIRTETVPILGRVTCHRLLFPQLRGALQEVVDAGLASAVHAGEYGGCYVPRFIGRDPDNEVSMHGFGLAVDLNVPGNQRGTVGQIDPRVVTIFKRWGFRWGGDWKWTDPMHFEMAALLATG